MVDKTYWKKVLNVFGVLFVTAIVYWSVQNGVIEAVSDLLILLGGCIVGTFAVILGLLPIYLVFYIVCCVRDGVKETHNTMGIRALLRDIVTENK